MGTLQDLRQYRPRRRWAARAFLLGLLLAAAAAGCGRQTVEVPPPGAAEAPRNAEVHRVLFLHGYRGEPWLFDRFWLAALRFLPANCEVYIVTGLPSAMGAMDEDAEGPVAVLEDWLAAQRIPLENLHLVAHSMGGLLARRFVAEHPGAVRQVFLLGTPSGGVNALNALNPKGWCTPQGIAAFNSSTPPDPAVKWYVLAGDRYHERSATALLEDVPNDGVVSVASVLHFVALCGDSVPVEWAVMPVSHPNWDWGENLQESKRVIRWVVDRLRADIPGPPAGGAHD